ncbi:MAG: hypothetical protein WAQ98_06545 [Blastocatellia bacterium]
MNTAQFINILATHLRLNDRLRIFLYALASLCTTKKCTLQLFDIQRMISNLSTDTEEKYLTRMQIMRLFVALEKVQHQLGSKLVHFSFDDDNEDIVYIGLLFTEQYDNVITYAKSQIDKTKCDWVSALTLAVNYYFPFELVLETPRRSQPTYAKTKRKLEKIPSLFSELVELGKTEGVDIDEIQRELTETAAKINTDVALMVAELEKWDEQQRETLNREQEQNQNQQIAIRNQQINLNNNNTLSENADDINSSNNQQTVKECVHELKQQYQQSTLHWYHLANNSIDENNKNNKNSNNNASNNKQADKYNKQTNNIGSIDHNINNSIKLNSDLIASSYLNHYT